MATLKKVKGLRSTKWEVRVRKTPYPTLTKTFSLKSDAENWARQTEINIEKGIFVGQSDCDLRLLSDIIKKYSEDITLSKRGAAVETIRLKKLCRHPLAKLEVKGLTHIHFVKYRDERLKEVSGSSVRKELALLSHVLSVAKQEWGVDLQSNPLKSVTKPRESKQRERRLEVNEETALLKSSSDSKNHWLTPIIIIAIETGMRRGELLSLKWEDVDLDLRVGHLDMTKNGSSRDVPLSYKAIDVLNKLPRNIDGKVFPISATALRGLWGRARKRAGITNLHFHDLRHEATSRFFEKGLNVMEVATITGHKDLRMLQRYTHLRAEDLAKKLG